MLVGGNFYDKAVSIRKLYDAGVEHRATVNSEKEIFSILYFFHSTQPW